MENYENKRKLDRLQAIEPIEINIKGNKYRLHDISEYGLGIIVDGENSFPLGQRIDSIPLQLNDKDVALKGVVTHISKTDINYLCGIRFIFDNIEEYKSVVQFKKEINPGKLP